MVLFDSGVRRLAIAALATFLAPQAIAAAGNVTTFAGGGSGGGSGNATSVSLTYPRALALDASGATFYFASGNSVLKVTGGNIETVAANAGSADALAADIAGNLYYCDKQNHQVKRIDPSGVVSIVAGTGAPGFSGDNGPATAAQLDQPGGIALLGADLLIADINNQRIRRISGGTITTVAGNGTVGDAGDGGPAVQAQVGYLGGIVADGAGGFHFVQGQISGVMGLVVASGRVRHVDNSGNITTLAPLFVLAPGSMARDASGNLYVAGGVLSEVIHKISPGGAVTIAAGSGGVGFSGDNGPATSATFITPTAVAISPAGEIYIADSGNDRIRKVDTAGIVKTVAGGGNGNGNSNVQAPGDGGPPEQAVLKAPDGIAVHFGSVLIADPADHRVREVAGNILTLAGTGTAGSRPPGVPDSASRTPLNAPHGAIYLNGNVYIASTGNDEVVEVQGCCQSGYANVTGPTSIAFRGNDVYVASPSTNRVYKLPYDNFFHTPAPFAGNGSPTHGGDGGPATSAGMTPGYITFDAAGNLYISDGVAHRVRKVDTAGNISTVAGNGTKASSGDGGSATAASLDTPAGLAVANGVLYIAEAGGNRIRAVRPDGVIEAVAGTGTAGFGGDGGPASAAIFDGLRGMAWDETTSSLLVADSGNHRVRRIEIIDTVPAAFDLGELFDVAQTTPVQSNPITPVGYNSPAAISVTGGEYSIGCTTAFTSAAGALAPGQSVCVRHVSASFGGTETATILTIGGVSATFRSRTAPAGTIDVAPASITFPSDPNTPQTVTIKNTGAVPVRVTSITAVGPFSVSHDCALLAPAATCAAQVSYAPPATNGFQVGQVLIDATSANADYVVTLAAGTATTVVELITSYYQSILRRAPDGPGLAFWQGEVVRMATIGANTNEVFYAMAAYFFFSPEYASFARDNTGFVTDLYNTFFNRAPDGGGLTFWTAQLGQAMPREVVIASFLFSPEFADFMARNTGATPARAEVDVVMDFYRGLLGRLPDPDGFTAWVNNFRTAQCQGAAAVNVMVEAISSGFAGSGEYTGKNRTDAQYVGDLYNAFLRRGGDLGGVQFWINQLNTSAMTRNYVRQQFIASIEFQARVANVVNQGCLP